MKPNIFILKEHVQVLVDTYAQMINEVIKNSQVIDKSLHSGALNYNYKYLKTSPWAFRNLVISHVYRYKEIMEIMVSFSPVFKHVLRGMLKDVLKAAIMSRWQHQSFIGAVCNFSSFHVQPRVHMNHKSVASY